MSHQIREGTEVLYTPRNIQAARLMHGSAGISDFGSDEFFESTLDAIGDTLQPIGSLGSAESSPRPRLSEPRRFDGSIHLIFASLTYLAQDAPVDRRDIVESTVTVDESSSNIMAK